MYNFVAKHVMAPTLDLLRGTNTVKCLRELEESQWWPREKIMELQNQRLRQLVKYAYDNVPYYQRVFDERELKPKNIETSEDLAKLPILNKQIIRANFSEIRSVNLSAKEIVKSTTGGSTGQPLLFYTTRCDRYNWGFAAEERAYGWIGINIGDKCFALRLRREQLPLLKTIGDKIKAFFERTMLFDGWEMYENKMSLIVQTLEDFQPTYIRAAPSAAYILARFLEKEKRHEIKPKAIITIGEQLHDYQRDLFNKVFECDTFSSYGSAESFSTAFECVKHSGYHIAAENVILEIVDGEGKLLPVGEKGRILITNLHNCAMPFIRYEIGDMGAISDRTCSCGRGLPLLTTLNGKIIDIIHTRSKGRTPGGALGFAFLADLGIEEYQVVQETLSKVVVKLVPGKGFQQHADESGKVIMERYLCVLGEDMDISIELVDSISPTAKGKRPIVLSKLPQEE